MTWITMLAAASGSATPSATTTAIIAATASLAGAAVGAATGGIATYLLERRREKFRATGAARLLRSDLKTVAEHLALALGDWRANASGRDGGTSRSPTGTHIETL